MSNTSSCLSQKLKSKKYLLFTAIICSAVVDVCLLISMLVGTMFDANTITFILLIIFDLFLLTSSYLSNFRFKYSRVIPVIYTVFVCVISVLVAFFIGKGIFTTTATIFFLSSHLLFITSLWVCVYDALNKGVKFKLFTVITLGVTLAMTAVSISFVFAKGTFGQGYFSSRALVYEYQKSTDTYSVVGIVKGKGKTAVIPSTFNDKEISSIDCSILGGLSNLYIEGKNQPIFENVSKAKFSNDLNIYVDKSVIDNNKQTLVNDFKKQKNPKLIQLSNCIVPSGLDNNEVYVTFNYNEVQLGYANYKLIPTWFGQKGSTFDMAKHASNVSYVGEFDVKNEGYLKDRYDDSKTILTNVTNNNQQLNHSSVLDCVKSATLLFEEVYRIKVGEDNDALFEDLNFKNYNGSNYRYLTKSDYNSITSQLTREGFTVLWDYSVANSLTKKQMTNLSNVLSQDMTIYPVYKMEQATIDSITPNKDYFVYGDNVNYVANVTKPNFAFDVAYEWKNLDTNVNCSSNSNMTMANVLPSQSGAYSLKVSLSYENSSLTSENIQSFEININKKELNMLWTLPTNKTYDGTSKSILCEYDASDVINGDTITFTQSLTNVVTASSYEPTVSLTNYCNYLYEIPTADKSVKLTILPKEVNVVWGTTNLTYNGAKQTPTASVNNFDICGSDIVPVSVSTTASNKNVGDYVATATTTNGNYLLKQNVTNYNVAPKGVTLSWNNTSFVYDKGSHKPTANVSSGKLEYDSLPVTVSGEQVNVGTYTAVASLSSNNYKIIGNGTTTFTITPKTITVFWGTETLTYNGKENYPTLSASGVYNGDDLGYQVTNAGKNAGTHTVSATITNPNYAPVTAIPDCTYTINAKSLNVTWGNTSLTYNGAIQKPTASVNSSSIFGNDNVPITVSTTATNKNAGNYVATAETTNTNYKLNQYTTNYTVAKKSVTLSWSNTSLTYNGNTQTPTATVGGGVLSGDTVTANVSGGQVDVRTSYTATATPSNGNYKFTNATQGYSINKATITVIWGYDEFNYDGNYHKPQATATGVNGEIVSITVSGQAREVGNHTATASTTNSNYKISNVTHSFTIREP